MTLKHCREQTLSIKVGTDTVRKSLQVATGEEAKFCRHACDTNSFPVSDFAAFRKADA